MTQDYDDTDAMLNDLLARGREMTQNTEQNVRTRDEQIDDLVEAMSDEVWVPDHKSYCEKMILEAEARGAEEQRRKDAEACDFIYQIEHEDGVWHEYSPGFWKDAECPDDRKRILYTHPANVAALEDRVRKLEGERDRLRDALIACGNNAGGFLAPGVSAEFLIECVPEEVRLKISSLTREGGPT